MEDIFARTELLIGQEGLEVLQNSRVMVFGLGGVGSYAAEALARAGVGNLVLIDCDCVAPSNINRQIHALLSTLGKPKALLMAERTRQINPRLVVEARVERYTPGDGERFLSDTPDYVVDAIDDGQAKVDLLAGCVCRGIPVVSAMGAGNKLDPTAFRVADIAETAVCPLARVVRRRLRERGIHTGVKVVFSTEPPLPSRGTAPDNGRTVPGSISFVPPVAGFILAGVVVRDLLARRGNNI
ncbi:MAG TPA: tRNA threonylcarbamoyladenosine dehydratase [Desulfotomaculum sp.]|nr:tRNA threonylcarbamoyladenosine dehydratase [Desulfotomaculum sp.]